MPEYQTVFFYGLFMDPKALEGKNLHPVNVRQAFLDGFSLRVGRRAFLVPDPSGRVYGMVMSLPARELDGLYADPTLNEYRPARFEVQIVGAGLVYAVCYNLKPSPENADHSNVDYVDQLRAAARRVGLPEDYVRLLH